MLALIVAFVLLIAAVGAIYLILRNMGEDGVKTTTPNNCRSGKCGVRNNPGINTVSRITEEPQVENNESRSSSQSN